MADVVSIYSIQKFGNMAEQFGLAELTANINALNKRLSDALPDIVMQAALIVEAEIRQRAPVDTGALVAGLDAQASHRKTVESATVQIDRSGMMGAPYDIFQEFGTSKMAAQPFFRPGVEAARTKVDELIAMNILDIVEST